MVILVVVSNGSAAKALLRWGSRIAAARKASLVVLALESVNENQELQELSPEDARSRPMLAAVASAAKDLEPGPRLLRFSSENAVEVILKAIQTEKADLLLFALQRQARDEDLAWKKQLFDRALCETLILRSNPESGSSCAKILVPVSTGPHCPIALRLAEDLVRGEEASITALHIEPEFGEEAEALGMHQITSALNHAQVKASEKVQLKVMLSNDIVAGIARTASEGYDLVLVGASEMGFVRRALFGSIPKALLAGDTAAAVGVIRRARPLEQRLRARLEAWLDRHVPQLERPRRLAVYAKLQDGSAGGFDFMTLTGLSTLIASLGLIQDSAAVVIGAMLVAPLMTPMIGAGLGLVQGNIVLVREAAKSVFFGFFLAFGVGAACGLLFGSFMVAAPESSLSQELLRRCHPTVLDLIIALASGIAAAYAQARPRLSSALPGVAIAAALVPPIATAGIAAASLQLEVAVGAITLFTANLVAIVLGSSFALYLIGIRGPSGDRRRHWARHSLLFLLLAAIALGFALAGHFLGPPPSAP